MSSLKNRLRALEEPANSRPLVSRFDLSTDEGIKQCALSRIESMTKGQRVTVKNFAGEEAEQLVQQEVEKLLIKTNL